MHHSHHHLWLWLWFGVGALAYIVKRAFYMITGPNPVANNAEQYIRVAGIPIAYRLLVDSGFYWACFSPLLLQNMLRFFGWQAGANVIGVVTDYGVCALMFGLTVDSGMDWAIPTVIGKLPFLKDWWPQMPGPMGTNVNVTDENISDAKKNVEAAVENLKGVPPGTPNGGS